MGIQRDQVIIRWVPDHQKIPGNERIDCLAKHAYGEETIRTTISMTRASYLTQDK